MKKGLILNAINPKIWGVLLRGEKGTAKSMAVRSLAQLLPQIEGVSDCPFFCKSESEDGLCDTCAARAAQGEEFNLTMRQVPVVEMPIGATEDRVVGMLDIEKAIKTGEKHFEAGLLAAANRGILYIDEVNLLDDHLVDVLLDVAAMGVNYVEREGISFSHPAQFIMVGTMNPEEGELRPQLQDRFGLAVEVKGMADQEARAEVVRRRIAFERDPAAFAAAYEKEQEGIRQRVLVAKKLLPAVQLSEEMLKLITQICIDFAVDGHRADIVIHKTATTIAAYHGRTEVSEEDVREAAELALLHRRRRQPFEQPEMNQQQLEESIQSWRQNQENQPEDQQEQEEKQDSPPTDTPPNNDNSDSPDDGEEPQREQTFEAEPPYKVKPLVAPVLDQVSRSGTGRRSKSRTNSKTGRYVESAIPRGKTTDLAFDATLRAAAPFQARRREETPGQNALLIEGYDLREKVREKKVGNLILFVLDASGSMAAVERMKATKGAVLSLLLDAYQRRDRVGMVVFRGEKAELVLPPTNSVELAKNHLTHLPTGGRTPLARGLNLGLDTIKEYLWRDKQVLPLLVLVSDGKGNVSLNGGDPIEEARRIAQEIRAANIRSIVVDTEQGFVTLGLVEQISTELGGTYIRLEELKSEPIISAVQGTLGYREERR
ncbi:putative cobaltochelatase [Dehalococcoidia bacterium]|nr:putative cobaltochelatase [Dehalococcoidia bacterium]MCL0097557.1 putative cobaltochelatase [Dehalococcoidia bacterium]